MDDKTLYVCRKHQLEPKSISGRVANAPLIEYSEDGTTAEVTFYVERETHKCFDIIKRFYVQRSGTLCPCIDPSLLQTVLNFFFDATSEEVEDYSTPQQGDTLTEITTDNYPTIQFGIPDTCKIVGMTVDMMGPVSRVTVIQIFPEINCETSPGDYDSQWTDNQFIPGSLMQLTTYLNCSHPQNVIEGDSAIWNTCSLTGGIVTAVNGDYDDPDHTFMVALQDGSDPIEVAPTDWVKYRVDDWVTILTVGRNGESLSNKGNIDWRRNDKLLIAPFYYGKYPLNPGLTHASIPIALNNNKPVMHLRNIPATILGINTGNNTANVSTVAFGTLENVAFMWHCPDSPNVLGAHLAYEIDDIVNLVIPDIAHDAHDDNPAVPPTPYIMGWQDAVLKPCNLYLYFFYDPIICYDQYGNIVESDSEDKLSSARIFDVFEYVSMVKNDKDITKVYSKAQALNSVCWSEATGLYSEHGTRDCTGHWSKTVGGTTVHAVSWKILQLGPPLLQWGIFVEVKGNRYIFQPDPDDDLTQTGIWPETPFIDLLDCSQDAGDGSYIPVKAFDIFVLEYDQLGWTAGDTIVVMYGDKISVEIWNITQNDYKFQAIPIYTEILSDFSSEQDVANRTIALGCDENIIYIAYATMYQEKMTEFFQIYAYNIFEGTFTALGESGDFCCYNPFTTEVAYFEFGATEEETGDYMDGARYVRLTQDNPICNSGAICNNWYYNGAWIGHDRLTPFHPSTCDTDCDPACNDPDCTCSIHSAEWSSVISEGTRTSKLDGNSEKITGAMCPDYNYYFFIWAGHDDSLCGTQEGALNFDLGCPIVDGGLIPYRQYGDYYKDWILSSTIQASITEQGSACRIKAVVQNGMLASNSANSTDTLEESDKNFDYGDIEEDFVVDNWPHLPFYAIAKDVSDINGTEYDSLVAIQNNAGKIIFDGDDLGSYEGMFYFYPSISAVEVNA